MIMREVIAEYYAGQTLYYLKAFYPIAGAIRYCYVGEIVGNPMNGERTLLSSYYKSGRYSQDVNY